MLPTENYAADAMRTIDDPLKAAHAWNADRMTVGRSPISIGMAIVTSRIIFGAVGDDTRLEYTVIGDPVNLCAKLEKHNRAAHTRALTTCDAVDLAVRQGYVPPTVRERREAESIDGVAVGVDLVVLAKR